MCIQAHDKRVKVINLMRLNVLPTQGYLNNPNAQSPDYPEQVAVGSYSYTAPTGEVISLSYKADANGFVPVGDHLPVAPDQTAEWYE